jgi:hypothetical protein
MQAILITAACTQLFAALDYLIQKAGLAKPYYGIHALHNVAIVYYTYRDLVITDITTVFQQEISWPAVYLCFALHFYHVQVYWRSFHYEDWLHHVLMIGVALPLGLCVPAGPLMGFSLFFTTGLPGGISYAALFAQRNGWIVRATEKRLSKFAHLWIRSPGCVAHATLTLVCALSLPLSLPLSTPSPFIQFQQIAAILIAILTAWNGQYYMEQVVTVAAAPSIAQVVQ